MSRRFFITTALVTLSASPALADLTAAQVWADWQAFATRNGYELSAVSEAQSGSTLTVSGVTVAFSDGTTTTSGDLGEFTFTERGDGTVSVDVPASWPLTFSGTDAEGADFTTTMNLAHDGLTMVASGTPEQTLYTYTAPSVSLTSDGFTSGGETIPMTLAVTMTNLAGEYEITDGDAANIRSDMNAASVAGTFSATDTEDTGNTVNLAFNMSDLVSTSNGTMSSLTAMSGLGDMVAQGLSSEGRVSYKNATYQFSGVGDGQDFQLNAGAADGVLDVSVGPEGLSYAGTNTGITVNAMSSQMPLPDASLAMDSSSWQFDMPVGVSEEPQDFALLLKLEGLTASDMIWSMFDPTSVLPRDPASLIVDLVGKGNWLVDITDPALDETQLTGAPGEIEALTVRELRLDVAGAELTGTGDLTFNNQAMPPVPVGAINLQLVGGNGLIDKLVSMGLMPEEQAMGMRMMLGIFATPGDGDDTLLSTIEFTSEGGIVANGQPLQ
jgi:hypothetical protein